MPVSNIAGGGVPGLSLRAWVLFNGTNGAIISQSNVSGVVRNGVGDYTVTFANALASAQYVTKTETTSTAPNTNNWASVNNALAGSLKVATYLSGSNSDAQACYVAVYA